MLRINGRHATIGADVEKPLLWVLRDELGLMGTKFSCGIGVCGACAVLLDGKVVRSCVTPVRAAADGDVVTIEGLISSGAASVVRAAWIVEQVPQCGYCQSGMILAATALLRQFPDPTDAQIGDAIQNLCRCGTYPRVRRAIHRAAAALHGSSG